MNWNYIVPILFLAIAVAALGFKRLLAIRNNIVREPRVTPPRLAGVLDFDVPNIDGERTSIAQYKGSVVLIVNVASKCVLTSQYAGLQKLYDTYKDRGLVIIGFPANNFAGQEPGGGEQIKTFCQTRFGVTFPMMAKISVKGRDKHPVYQFLTERNTAGIFAGEIKWNFAKFLIDRSGHIMARFGPGTSPLSPVMINAIEKALSFPPPERPASR